MVRTQNFTKVDAACTSHIESWESRISNLGAEHLDKDVSLAMLSTKQQNNLETCFKGGQGFRVYRNVRMGIGLLQVITQSLNPELYEPLGCRFCELRHLKLCKGSLRCDADDVNRCPGRAVLDNGLGFRF